MDSVQGARSGTTINNGTYNGLLTGFSTLTVTSSGSDVTVYVNDGPATSLVLGGQVSKSHFIVGHRGNADVSHYLDGDVAELIVYTRALAEAERVLVEDYLRAKYAIAP